MISWNRVVLHGLGWEYMEWDGITWNRMELHEMGWEYMK
jgi:hypothetical protein